MRQAFNTMLMAAWLWKLHEFQDKAMRGQRQAEACPTKLRSAAEGQRRRLSTMKSPLLSSGSTSHLSGSVCSSRTSASERTRLYG